MNKRLQERKLDRVLKWKRNGPRHSFISYRVADTQNVNQVALEAGNVGFDPRLQLMVDRAQGQIAFGVF